MTKLISIFSNFLWVISYFFFVVTPVYFIIHLIFNYLSISNSILFLIGTFLISWRLLPYYLSELYEPVEISKFATIALLLGTTLLIFISLVVGIDESHDAYFYHLNTAVPIALYHQLSNFHLYDLVSYSQGYPKFGEFLQAIGIQLTNYFWGYGVITALVIPASYTITYLLAKRLGLESQYADKVALTYAFNPINVAQATTGYIDSLQALYVLANLLFAIRLNTRFKFIVLLLNVIALLNIKFTGIVIGSLILLFAILVNSKFILDKRHLFSYAFGAIIAYIIGLSHYFSNFINFNTLTFPFIDLKMAKFIANIWTIQGNKLEKIVALFWSFPKSFAHISLYDTPLGAFSILWYPLPMFIFLALIKAFLQRDYLFLSIQGLFWLLLILDPTVAMGRYVTYFQFLGFFSAIYLLKNLVTFISPNKTLSLITLLPFAYLVLGSYIIFNPELGRITRRLAHYQENRLLITSLQSTSKQTFDYYYNINSPCSGYYWLLKFNQVEVQLTQDKPKTPNYFYIHHDKGCTFSFAHEDLSIHNRIYYDNEKRYLEMNSRNLFAAESCKWCLSEYNCLYAPFYADQYTIDLFMLPFQSPGEKEVRVECLSIDGQVISDIVRFQVN